MINQYWKILIYITLIQYYKTLEDIKEKYSLDSKTYQTKKNSKPLKGLNCYNKELFYRSIQLSSSLKVSEFYEIIDLVFNHIYKNKSLFDEIVQKVEK